MVKKKGVIAGDLVAYPDTESRSWARAPGSYIAGRAYLDEADMTAAEMEAKWGADRLRLLVGPELREKFDRQRYKLNAAVWHGELEAVRREAMRMVTAWLVLDKAATAAGKGALSPEVWEVAINGGDSVAAIVVDVSHAKRVVSEGRAVAVYTLEEIGRLLTEFPAIAMAKITWPGATVTEVRRSIDDPLASISDTDGLLDDPLPW